VAAGGRLLIGGDATDFGVVHPGFAPLQVIRFATSDAADFLGVGRQGGTVAAGQTADLLIVKGAPDRRIEDIHNVSFVFKDGAVYDPVKLRAAAKGMLGQH
jgi:imidazolonepropionase-like amidohydrolase